MIDLHYGHLAVDSHKHAVSLLDALAVERAVDAGWTSTPMVAKPDGDRVLGLAGDGRSGPWTLGGRRGANPPSTPKESTKEAD